MDNTTWMFFLVLDPKQSLSGSVMFVVIMKSARQHVMFAELALRLCCRWCHPAFSFANTRWTKNGLCHIK